VGYWEADKDKRVTQLRKGILELAVMAALYHERHYGYSLIRVLTESGAVSLKEGTIYPILARLDRDGLVRSEWVESVQGPPRKYYTLTPSGRQLFTDLREEFDLLISLVKQDWTQRGESESASKKLFIRKR
jgi:PadR family transcriptional regulator PadR